MQELKNAGLGGGQKTADETCLKTPASLGEESPVQMGPTKAVLDSDNQSGPSEGKKWENKPQHS